ncbi:hypothetical protein SAMN02745116_01054 [Pilibacter termitis]|uniref:DUF956 family protein n=1 Tax=Pilibacter termitis TaxID=263852 RepID=A0A1T4MDH0_9ENTE|nr:DUF956 family protein [Pilibacter termitis]SJZ64906.1 hypothetical protein SAMN02745116_01054 [Pilibacter termitis]
MVESINTKVEYAGKGTSFLGLGEYGNILIGDKGFEFFNTRNVNDYIQIPWEEVDIVVASILFKGKYIPRFAVVTKKNGTYSFASKEPKVVLARIRDHIGNERVLRSLSAFQVTKNGLSALLKRLKK